MPDDEPQFALGEMLTGSAGFLQPREQLVVIPAIFVGMPTAVACIAK
jgi:hypothetical protein